MSDQLIVVPWGAVRKDWKVMPESQLSSIIDVYSECRKGGQSRAFAALVSVRPRTEVSGFCQNTAPWVGEVSVGKSTYRQAEQLEFSLQAPHGIRETDLLLQVCDSAQMPWHP